MLGLVVTDELLERQVAHGVNVTELRDVLVRVLLHSLVHGLVHVDEADVRTLLHHLLHPHVVVPRAQAGAHGLAVHLVVRRAVAHPGRVLRIRAGHGVHVLALLQLAEHGARVAGLEVEDNLLVLLLLEHLVDGVDQNILLKIALTDLAETNGTVVHVVHENGILRTRLDHLGVLNASQLLGLLLVAREGSHEQLSAHVLVTVIHVRSALSSVVHTGTIGVLIREDLAGEGVLGRIEGLVEAHVHDMVLSDTRLVQDVEASADRGGNAVVEPARVAGHEQSPLVSRSNAEQGDHQKERSHHLQISIYGR